MNSPSYNFTSWEDFYGEVFAVADQLWSAGHRLEASWLALSTDGSTSGEILPKLRDVLDGLTRSPKVIELGLDGRCRALVDAIDGMLKRPRP